MAMPKLLIVEDEEPLREMLKEFLKDYADFKIVTATDRKSAVAALEEYQPAGMLLDVMLPTKPDGLEVLAAARRVSPHTKTIMVTGTLDLDTIQCAKALGAIDYITKPFTLDYLERTLKEKIAECL
jgi:DNA-binding NtrC family response regulator